MVGKRQSENQFSPLKKIVYFFDVSASIMSYILSNKYHEMNVGMNIHVTYFLPVIILMKQFFLKKLSKKWTLYKI